MVTLYVEGGGDATALKAACRKGFSDFLGTAGLRNKPRIVACGSRRNAYERFCLAMQAGDPAFLLVDSEDPVAAEHQSGMAETWHPWRHVKARPGDGWDRPQPAKDEHYHLMVQCMETWFISDPMTLQVFFGTGFTSKSLPKSVTVETISKAEVYGGLAKATKSCKTKAPYGKGEHSFKLLALIDPAKVMAASPWAARFVKALKTTLDA